MATINVDIVSAEGQIHHGEAAMVFAPAQEGEIGIAPRHAPLLTRLSPGEVRVQTPAGEQLHFFVGGGILEIQPQAVTVLADTALRARDADEAAAQEARRNAEENLARAHGDIDLARAQAELAQAAALVQFVKKIKGQQF
ncbi:MAG TPA: F0F1 ATP synthase subunit epsilon [Nevskiaceae bacterium]|nr:F0F1 ATP synthase subunit epsilon [Nevskiaceae bacterium]